MARKSNRKSVPFSKLHDGHLKYEGWDRQLYCWIRQHRKMCAVHKSLYYDCNTPILSDFQYDRLEQQLIVVEQRHPEIANAVTTEGYDSPNDYVGSTHNPSVMETAEWLYQHWKSQGCPDIQLKPRQTFETDEILYADALQHIQKYPI